jgi:hypothetical protein
MVAEAYRIEPHLIHASSIFVFRQLYTPFAAVLICFVLPGWNDALLVVGWMRNGEYIDDRKANLE